MKLIKLFLLLGIVCGTAYSLRCYQCASLTSSSCSTNGLRNVQPTTCLPVFNACQKIRTETFGVVTETRSCTSASTETCTTNFLGVTTCTCLTDGCNGTASAKVSIVVILASTMLSCVFA